MSELLEAGLTVTLVGLGVVFALLTTLVGIIRSMSYLSHLIDGGAPAAAAAAQDVTVEDEIVSAISAAIRRYERNHGLRRGHP
jgi:Na+-transporting methylmalonyl-CoA/oxaloacetate decarboxylase gamma subunit